jgi:hypothetical protein
MEQTLQYINTKFGGSYVVDVQHANIVATYNENGNPFREDQVFISDLDSSSIKYNSAQGMFTCNCKAAHPKCVTRNLFILRETKTYGRISFPVNLNEKSANGLINAFHHLIRLVEIKKYKSSQQFE